METPGSCTIGKQAQISQHTRNQQAQINQQPVSRQSNQSTEAHQGGVDRALSEADKPAPAEADKPAPVEADKPAPPHFIDCPTQGYLAAEAAPTPCTQGPNIHGEVRPGVHSNVSADTS